MQINSAKYLVYLFFGVIFCNSCVTVLEVSERKSDGLYLSARKATILKSELIDLDTINDLLVVPNGVFLKGMAKNINFFERVITIEELEKEIILSNKQDDVGSIASDIGLNKAYRKYKKFLFLELDRDDNQKKRIQLKLVNPNTLEELFVADVYWDTISGINDNHTFNPLFNSLILFIDTNSRSYNKTESLKI